MTAPVDRVWVLNLDADRELGRPLGYSSPRKILDQITAQRHLTADLVRGEPVLGQDGPAVVPRSGPLPLGVLWCPTPSARRRAERAGLRLPPAPPLDVLQRVNEKRFLVELRTRELDRELSLPRASRVTQTSEEEAFIRESRFVAPGGELPALTPPPSVGRGFRLKRNFGFAGRGQRTLAGPLRDDDHLFIDAALRSHGLVIEPAVELTLALSIHGWVFSSTASSLSSTEPCALGEPCAQEIDRHGAPTRVVRLASTTPSALGSIDEHELAKRLKLAGANVGRHLAAAGYFGPFGLDAFLMRAGGALHLLPFIDLNARFTLGWSTGMGAQREAILASLGAANLAAQR